MDYKSGQILLDNDQLKSRCLQIDLDFQSKQTSLNPFFSSNLQNCNNNSSFNDQEEDHSDIHSLSSNNDRSRQSKVSCDGEERKSDKEKEIASAKSSSITQKSVHSKNLRFTEKEDKMLQEGLSLYGKNWKAIAELVGVSKSRIRNRYYSYTRNLPLTFNESNPPSKHLKTQPNQSVESPLLKISVDQSSETISQQTTKEPTLQLTTPNFEPQHPPIHQIECGVSAPNLYWSSNLLAFDIPSYQKKNSFQDLRFIKSFHSFHPISNHQFDDFLFNQISSSQHNIFQPQLNYFSMGLPSSGTCLQLSQMEKSILAISPSSNVHENIMIDYSNDGKATTSAVSVNPQIVPPSNNQSFIAPVKEKTTKQQNFVEHFCPNQILNKMTNLPEDHPSPLIFKKANNEKQYHLLKNYESAVSSFNQLDPSDEIDYHYQSNPLTANLSESLKRQKIEFLQQQIAQISALLNQCKQDILNQMLTKIPKEDQVNEQIPLQAQLQHLHIMPSSAEGMV